MNNLGYYNGKFGPLEEMTVPMTERVCVFGDGVYDATPARNGVPFALDEHVARFYRSAAAVEIEIPHAPDELRGILTDMAARVEGDTMLYFQVSRGAAIRSHAFPERAKASMWIMVMPHARPDLSLAVDARTEEDTRFLHCDVKTLNLLPNVIASQRAKEQGCYETIWHRGGRVTECAHSNVHIISGGRLKTAPLDKLILPGIARAHLINMCARFGLPVEEAPYTMDELMAADEILISSSSAFCLRVARVDGRPVGGGAGEITAKLQAALTREFMDATSV